MRGPIRWIEITGIALLLIVLAIVGSRVSAESGDADHSTSSEIAGLLAQLRLAGLTVTVEGEAHDPRLMEAGTRLKVDGETVDVYAYGDAWSAEADAARLIDDDTGPTDGIEAPHLFRHNRLLVIHAGGSGKLNNILSALLTNDTNLHERR